MSVMKWFFQDIYTVQRCIEVRKIWRIPRTGVLAEFVNLGFRKVTPETSSTWQKA